MSYEKKENKNDLLYQKGCFVFFAMSIFSVFRSLKWKVKERKMTFADSFSSLTKEDDLFYKNMCWDFSFNLIFVNFQSIKVEGPEDINYFTIVRVIFTFFNNPLKIDNWKSARRNKRTYINYLINII